MRKAQFEELKKILTEMNDRGKYQTKLIEELVFFLDDRKNAISSTQSQMKTLFDAIITSFSGLEINPKFAEVLNKSRNIVNVLQGGEKG